MKVSRTKSFLSGEHGEQANDLPVTDSLVF